MRNTSFTTAVAIAVATLVVAGCRNDASLTSPSSAPARTVAPPSLGLASSDNLFNSDPLCPGARTPGFYCQNQAEGKNPNFAPGEFDVLAAEAESLLGGALGTLSVGDAVCIKGNKLPEDQLLRHLGALALNLAANLIDATTPLTDGSFPTVGAAFDKAVIAATSDDKQERNAIKDVLDDINNNHNTELGEHCEDDEGDEGDEGEEGEEGEEEVG